MRDPDTCQGKTAQQEDYDSMKALAMVLYSLVLAGGVLWAIWYSF